MSTKFGVDSSSLFPFRARTHTHRQSQTPLIIHGHITGGRGITASPPQNNLGRTRRRPSRWTPQIHTQICFFRSTTITSSNTPIPRPTPITTLNGIWIQSQLPQYTFRTDGQTHERGDTSVRRALTLYYIDKPKRSTYRAARSVLGLSR